MLLLASAAVCVWLLAALQLVNLGLSACPREYRHAVPRAVCQSQLALLAVVVSILLAAVALAVLLVAVCSSLLEAAAWSMAVPFKCAPVLEALHLSEAVCA